LENVAIRRATLADYTAVCELYAQVDALHRQALPHIFRDPQGPPREREYLSEVLAREDATLLVAEASGRIVGLVQVLDRVTLEVPILVPRHYALVDTLVVASDFRRRGVGRRLMEAAHDWARARGGESVELSVWAFNLEAVAFYQALGYEVARQVMVKRLPQ